MKISLAVTLCGVCALWAQTATLSGVWKANIEKSKWNGPPPSNYLVILEQQGSKLNEITGNFGPMGEQRSSFSYNTDDTQSKNTFRGLPMRTKAAWQEGALVLESQVAGRPMSIQEKYVLSPDGNTLTVTRVTTAGGKENQQTLVLERQPDSAGEVLRKPEQTAGERFKNVQLLKDLPASRFLDAMRSFSMSLGVDCSHCHVQNNFAAEDKPAKAMARKMITMSHGINEQTFGGKMVVRCYTCHRGQVEPQATPAF